MSKLDEYRDARALIEQLREIQADVDNEADGRHLNLRVVGRFDDDDENPIAGIGYRAENILADAIQHHMPAIIETALGLAGAKLMEARAQAALEAAAVLKDLQPVDAVAEGA